MATPSGAMSASKLFDDVLAWLAREPAVESAALFGSSAKPTAAAASSYFCTDIDLHVVSPTPVRLYNADWQAVFPNQRFCCHANQTATGGTHKITIVFDDGLIDIVVVSRRQMQLARWAMRLRLYRNIGFVRTGLNELSTTLRAGYRFLKGQERWGELYARVEKELPGVRLADSEACALADGFLVTLVIAFRWLERGELSAVQYALHRHLAETNFRLMRELQLRREWLLPSFGLARRVEFLLPARELSWIQVSARLAHDELLRALWSSFVGVRNLMAQLVPSWGIPPGFEEMIAPYATRPSQT